MAGLRGNQAWVAAGKQSGKGTPATFGTGTIKTPLSGGSISPARATDQLAETDAQRDRGVSYVVSSGVEGSPEFYVRDTSIGFWLNAVLGSDAVTGTTNYVHTITPANALPYYTVWKNLAATLFERYQDCKVGSLTISAEAGAPLTASAGIQGLVPLRLTANPDTGEAAGPPTPPTVALESSSVYNFNDAAVTLSGGATALVRSFELTIENNINRQQTDDVVPYDITEGAREVSLSFDLIFETLNEYNKFHYGGSAGTTSSPTIYTTDALFTFTKGTNNYISFALPSIAYEEFPVEPNTAGDPVIASIRAVGQRGSSPVVTATVANQVATAY